MPKATAGLVVTGTETVDLAALEIEQWIAQIAIRDEVLVAIRPGARRADGRSSQWVHVEIAVGRRDRFHVFSEIELDGRLAVPEDVVRHA